MAKAKTKKTKKKKSKEPPRPNDALGCDPGKYNFGWAHYDREEGLLRTGVIDGIDGIEHLENFRKQFLQLLKVTEPGCIGIERFHNRPGRGGKRNMELVNLAIGLMVEICIKKKIPWKLVVASAHKRWLAKNFEVGLTEEGERLKQQAAKARKRKKKTKKTKKRFPRKITKKFDITTYHEWEGLETEHECDAATIAKYTLEKIFV